MKPPSLRIVLPLVMLLAASSLDAMEADMPVVAVFAAGSLRGVVSEVSAAAADTLHIAVEPSFGGSGLMRERIEKGERPDLLLSADLASPRQLAAGGLALLSPVPFARNRMCIVSRRGAGLTASNLIDRLLAPTVRVRTSTPVADPSGDYAWAMFDQIESTRPGAGVALKSKANAVMTAAATPSRAGQSAAAALFEADLIDVSITYCSAASGLEKELPELQSLAVPARLDPRPVYGIAVLSRKPAALQLALFLLSEQGQAIIARNGLLPVLEPAAR